MEVQYGGMWIKWSSLKRQDKWELALAMACFFAAGFASGLTREGQLAAEQAGDLGVAYWLIQVLPSLLTGAGLFLVLRISGRQDELYQRMDSVAWKWSGVAVLLCLLVLITIRDAMGSLPLWPVPLAWTLGYAVGWNLAYRRYNN